MHTKHTILWHFYHCYAEIIKSGLILNTFVIILRGKLQGAGKYVGENFQQLTMYFLYKKAKFPSKYQNFLAMSFSNSTFFSDTNHQATPTPKKVVWLSSTPPLIF